ncbi:alpha/beta fold hydrolase [Marinigracilibium pacificum]|uniref:Alpha/beta fold hydrolase n=1 Tax=Marinigracilibium pacificum TaxID=2729599 RepID=A0A848J9T6_9BACT|nr:alpha/beta fold hydrolase [Marinigracilibium pacificum]NMM49802.1 alpha/beta fold hydrolase [Marinigracilibium pacificum]
MNLFYREYGKGENTLVILHGLFGSSDNWMSIAKALEDDYHIYVIDQRNHGQSPHSEEWNYEVMAKDIAEFIDENIGHETAVLGHSMGGKVAMTLALRYPEKVKKLLVADIAPKYYPIHHRTILDGLLKVEEEKPKSRNDADKILEEYIPQQSIRMFLLKNLGRNSTKELQWKINLQVINEKIEEVGKAQNEYSSTQIPSLFVGGENSDYILDDDKELIRNLFPKSNIIYLKNAGHWLHAEQPESFTKVIKDFMNYGK